MPIWTDSGLQGLPPAPASNDPLDVASFVDERFIAGNLAIIKHIDRRFDELRAEFSGAFPCNDPSMSRALLESIMLKEERKAAFWNHLAQKAAAGTVMAVAGAVVTAAWLGLLSIIGKELP